MNKEELVKQISEEFNLSRIEVSDFINDVFTTIETALRKGKNVNISEFGKFMPQRKTLEGIKQNSVSFSPVKKFSNDVNYNFNDLKPVTVALIPHASGKLQEVFEEFDEDDINEEELIDVITEEPAKEQEIKTEVEIAPYIESITEPEPEEVEAEINEEEEEIVKDEREEEQGEEIVIEDNPEEQDVFYEDRISDILIVDDKENGGKITEQLSDEVKPLQEIGGEFVPYKHVEEDYNEILNRLIEENKPAVEDTEETFSTEEKGEEITPVTTEEELISETETGAEDEEITDFAIPQQLREQNTITPAHEEIIEHQKQREEIEEQLKEDTAEEIAKEEPIRDEEASTEETAEEVKGDEYKAVGKDVPEQDIMKIIEERKKILEEIKRMSEEKTLSTELPSYTGKDEPKHEQPIEEKVQEEPIPKEEPQKKDSIGTYLEETEIIDTHDKDIKEEDEFVFPEISEKETDENKTQAEEEQEEDKDKQENEETALQEEKDEDILIPDFSFDKIFKETSEEEETKEEVSEAEDDRFNGGDILLPEDIKSLHDEIDTPASKEETYLTTEDNFKLKDYNDVFEQTAKTEAVPPPGIDFTKPEYKNFPGGPGEKEEDDKVFKKSIIVLVVVIAVVFSGLYYMYSTGLFSNGNGSKDTTSNVTPPSDNQIKVEKQQQTTDTAKRNTETQPQTQETRKDTVTAPPVTPTETDNTPEEQVFDPQRNLIFIKKGNDFYIQAGSYKERSAADEKIAELKNSGINAIVAEANIEGKGKFYRVRIGKYTSLEEAKTAADNL